MAVTLDDLARRSLVQVRLGPRQYLGVGFVIAPGLVVTNAHVAADGAQVWYAGTQYPVTAITRHPAIPPERGREWGPPDLAELTVPGLPVLLGPAFRADEDVEGLREVRVPTFDIASVLDSPDRPATITKRLEVTVTGSGLIGLGDGTLTGGMSGSPVIDMRSGRVRGVLKSEAWAVAPGGRPVPTGGWMIPLTEADTPVSWFEGNAAVNPVGNPWRRAAAAADRVQRDLFDPDEAPDEFTPANMLDPDSGLVPFETVDAFEELLRWCRHESRTIVRLISGTSGAGKTRIAEELCRRLCRDGWAAGLLRTDLPDGWRRTLTQALVRELQVAIVVDDAEHRGRDTAAVLRELWDAFIAARADGMRVTVRVLLVSRNEPDRFENELLHIDTMGDKFARWIRPGLAPPIRLPPVLPDPAGVLTRAWRAFATRLGVDTTTEPHWPPDLSGLTTLDLYAKAADEVLSTLPGYRPDRVADNPLLALRGHQLRYWAQKLLNADYRLPRSAQPPRTGAGTGLIDIPLAAAEAWLLVPTLATSADEQDLHDVMGRVAEALGAPDHQELGRLYQVYPRAAGGHPAKLTPDRLAETMFRAVCRNTGDDTLHAFLAAVLIGEDTPVQPALRLICRARAGADVAGDSAHGRIDKALTGLLAEHPRALLPPLTQVCGELPQLAPLVRLLTTAAQQCELDVLTLVEPHLPDDGRGLSPLALVTLGRQIDATSGNDDRSLANRISWWRRLSLHQYHLGRHDDALRTNQDAINECRVLRDRSGDFADAYAEVFARLHGDRALFLLQKVLGRRGLQQRDNEIEEALDNGELSIRAYRRLGRDHHTALADVLHNQDILYAAAGRLLQALACGEQALRRYGDTAAPRSRAAALVQVASDLRRLGRHPEALDRCSQGIAILIRLFDETPSAHAADLMRALGLRAFLLLNLGEAARREGLPDAADDLTAARGDLAHARQAGRSLPVDEPGLHAFLRGVETVLEEVATLP